MTPKKEMIWMPFIQETDLIWRHCTSSWCKYKRIQEALQVIEVASCDHTWIFLTSWFDLNLRTEGIIITLLEGNKFQSSQFNIELESCKA
jgi:hypothetical protein